MEATMVKEKSAIHTAHAVSQIETIVKVGLWMKT
jgi:hypothetical protein